MSSFARSSGLFAAAFSLGIGCSEDFDASRTMRPYAEKASLGDDIYGLLCDRISAGALNEDASGGSFRAVCHADASGRYADKVDLSRLPPSADGFSETRRLAVAKVEALAGHRENVIHAINTTLPDIEVDDPHPSESPAKKVRFHDALRLFVQRLTPLYSSNPLAAQGADPRPLLPAATQSLEGFFKAFAESSAAQQAMAQLGGRQGYRPLTEALGTLGVLMRYPELRALTSESIRAIAPGGAARTEFEHALKIVYHELRTKKTSLLPAPFFLEPSAIAQPNRPRDTLELIHNVLLTSDPAFASAPQTPSLVVTRDPRGYALITGTALGSHSLVPLPFVDSDSDGLGDLDELGRFIGVDGTPVAVDRPFDMAGKTRFRAADSLGRALLPNGLVAYDYLDTATTLVASLATNLSPLLDPNPANERETLFDALAGITVLVGDRADRNASYDPEQGTSKVAFSYRSHDASSSPLIDLAFAAGQLLSVAESDDFLQLGIHLLRNYEPELARLVGAALNLKSLADQYPSLSLPQDSTFWDEMADFVSRAATVGPADGSVDGRSLLEDLIVALGNDETRHLGHVFANFATYKDLISYNPDDINGPPRNLTSDDLRSPHVAVDRSKPDRGENRSILQRSMQLTNDADEVKTCNKAGAKVVMTVPIPGIPFDPTMPITYPDNALLAGLCSVRGYGGAVNPSPECSIIEIDNLAAFYLKTLVGTARFDIKDACLRGVGKDLVSMDEVLERSSGLTGLTTQPTYKAATRMLFFGADAPFGMADFDPYRGERNARINTFVGSFMDPAATVVCPTDANGNRRCVRPDETIRLRDRGTIFTWEVPWTDPETKETFTFRDTMRPILDAFVSHERPDLFVYLTSVLNRHWASKDHGLECAKKGEFRKYLGHTMQRNPKYNPAYCAEDGLSRYEELLAKQFSSDLLPAMRDLIKKLQKDKLPLSRFRQASSFVTKERRTTEIMASMTRALFSEDYASSIKLTDRAGRSSALYADGITPRDQVTFFDLFANALKAMDARFESAPAFSAEDRTDRRTRWRRARSRLVDQFLTVDGTGPKARFRNGMVPKAALTTVQILREQINAQCPLREQTGQCDWGRHQLTQSATDVLQGPVFGALIDLLDKLRQDPSHIEIERLMQYLLNVVNNDETFRSFLVSAADGIQVLRDGQSLPPVFNVLATLVQPSATDKAHNHPESGAVDIGLQLLTVLLAEPDASTDPRRETEFDRYHILQSIIGNLSKPIDDSKTSKSALEVFIDCATDVNRYDSANPGPLDANDYATLARSVQDFLQSPTRGIEQLYEIVQRRNGD